MGSAKDWEVVRACADTLRELGIEFEVRVLSAHRTPQETMEYAVGAAQRGIRVIIAAAGYAAHLAGVVAAHSDLPVIGIPVTGMLGGLDALLSTAQMPRGVPVATVAVGKAGAVNAAALAARILALGDDGLAQRLSRFRERMRRDTLASQETLSE
ncbi:MAG TPA: 5-(carboxyamino)imidazole ribonucleotide mutase [Kiritimatiellae bacterium]|nr:5-(carboxyamino)imidazole ribonucleotide mutase [Kiritimatiellia bacterium]